MPSTYLDRLSERYTDLFDAAPAAQAAADATGVAHHVRKERSTGLLVVQPSEPVDGRRFLTMWGPAEPQLESRKLAAAETVARLLCSPTWPGAAAIEDVAEVLKAGGFAIADVPGLTWDVDAAREHVRNASIR